MATWYSLIPLSCQLLYILRSDGYVVAANLSSLFTLSVCKVSSEVSNFSLFVCKLRLQFLHLFFQAWSAGHQDRHVFCLVIAGHLDLKDDSW